MKPKFPNFLGIGAPRSGTTWIAEILRSHPNIFIANGKETLFFISEKKYARGLNYYSEQYYGAKDEKAIGEISPLYLGAGERCARRIKQFNPNMKFVVLIRNPVDRAWSYYNWLIRYNKNDDFYDVFKNDKNIISDGLFYKNIKIYLNFFSKNNFLILNYDGIKNDPKKIQIQLFNFLNVDENYNSPFSNKIIGETLKPRFQSLENLRHKTHHFLKKRKKLSKIIPIAKKIGFSGFYGLINNDKRKIKQIQKHQADFAYNFFEDDLLKLREIVDFNIDHWLK